MLSVASLHVIANILHSGEKGSEEAVRSNDEENTSFSDEIPSYEDVMAAMCDKIQSFLQAHISDGRATNVLWSAERCLEKGMVEKPFRSQRS